MPTEEAGAAAGSPRSLTSLLPRGCLSAGRRWQVFGLARFRLLPGSYFHAFPPISAVAAVGSSRLPLRVSQSRTCTELSFHPSTDVEEHQRSHKIWPDVGFVKKVRH